MNNPEPIILSRDCDAVVVPAGNRVVLQKGVTAYVMQSLGGSYTVVVNGNMFRIEGKDADAIGLQPVAAPSDVVSEAPLTPLTKEELDQQIWEQMKTCFDPEIPVNIVDLGLIYECKIEPMVVESPEPKEEGYRVNVKMTLTAPGCGMADMLRYDVKNKISNLRGVKDVNVEVVFDPQWNQTMMSDAAKLQLGMM